MAAAATSDSGSSGEVLCGQVLQGRSGTASPHSYEVLAGERGQLQQGDAGHRAP